MSPKCRNVTNVGGVGCCVSISLRTYRPAGIKFRRLKQLLQSSADGTCAVKPQALEIYYERFCQKD
eukprot:2391159-Amphidinium_carterae.1